MIKKILRYAPSPTGHLHIGGARTALFNYLEAKHSGGTFFVRIEDTDREREIVDGDKEQTLNLEWLGIAPDFSPFNVGPFNSLRQSERSDIYNKYINILLEEKIAYESYCTLEEIDFAKEKADLEKKAFIFKNEMCNNKLNKERGVAPTLRIRMNDDEDLSWVDGVRNKISVESKDIGDWVAMKSNGIPTYNFANVIDDHLMGVTDILRGEEHISNTPKQIYLYKKLGWDIPKFFHLTIIVDETGKKLSKRNESVFQFISQYRESGYLPEAIINFLALLGWSPIGEEEFFTKDELIKLFDINRFSKSPSFFDLNKLKWMNNHYINKLDVQKRFSFLNKFVSDIEIDNVKKELIFETFAPGIKEGIEIRDKLMIFIDEPTYDSKMLEILNSSKNLFKNFINSINDLDDEVISVSASGLISKIGKELDLKGKDLWMPFMIGLIGKFNGPDVSAIINILGKSEIIKRLGKVIKNV